MEKPYRQEQLVICNTRVLYFANWFNRYSGEVAEAHHEKGGARLGWMFPDTGEQRGWEHSRGQHITVEVTQVTFDEVDITVACLRREGLEDFNELVSAIKGRFAHKLVASPQNTAHAGRPTSEEEKRRLVRGWEEARRQGKTLNQYLEDSECWNVGRQTFYDWRKRYKDE